MLDDRDGLGAVASFLEGSGGDTGADAVPDDGSPDSGDIPTEKGYIERIKDVLTPNLGEEQVSITADFHIHSEGSYDCREPVEVILEQAEDVGLDVIAVTDHDTIEYAEKAVEAADGYDVTVLPGVEVSTADGHLLAIGVDEAPAPQRPVAETVETVREQDGLAIVPHPDQWIRDGVPLEEIPDCDAVETYNPWLFTGYKNRKTERFAAEHGYPQVAASDAHNIATIGRAYTEIEVTTNAITDVQEDEILDAIQEGRTEVTGQRKPVYKSALDYGTAAVRKAAYTKEHPGEVASRWAEYLEERL